MKKGDIVEWNQSHSTWGRRVDLGMIIAIGRECNKSTPGWSKSGPGRNGIIEVMWSDGTLQKHLSAELALCLVEQD